MSMEMLWIRRGRIKKILLVVLAIMIIANAWERTLFGWVKLRGLQDSLTVGAVNKYDITEKNEVYKLDVFYQWHYGKLQRGTYRVTYPIKTEKDGKEELDGYFYATFQISK